MANKFTWKIEGIQEFEEQIAKLAQMHKADAVIRATFAKAIRNALAPTAEMSKAIAPYDELFNTSGIHLRDTIRLDSRIPTDKDRMSQYVEPTDAVIAVVSAKKSAVSLAQEFGTSRIDAHPFLRPALDKNAETVVTTFGSKLGSVIEDYAAKLNRRRK